MLVYNPDEKTWRCENPSDEETQELLELGKRAVLNGFSSQFFVNLMNAAVEEMGDDEPNKTNKNLN